MVNPFSIILKRLNRSYDYEENGISLKSLAIWYIKDLQSSTPSVELYLNWVNDKHVTLFALQSDALELNLKFDY